MTVGRKCAEASSTHSAFREYVPEWAPWCANFRAELLSFPAGKHDDICDALGLIGQLLDQMVAGRAPAKPVEREREDLPKIASCTIPTSPRPNRRAA